MKAIAVCGNLAGEAITVIVRRCVMAIQRTQDGAAVRINPDNGDVEIHGRGFSGNGHIGSWRSTIANRELAASLYESIGEYMAEVERS